MHCNGLINSMFTLRKVPLILKHLWNYLFFGQPQEHTNNLLSLIAHLTWCSNKKNVYNFWQRVFTIPLSNPHPSLRNSRLLSVILISARSTGIKLPRAVMDCLFGTKSLINLNCKMTALLITANII